MRILWQANPSILDPGSNIAGTPINSTDFMFSPPRGNFTRIETVPLPTTGIKQAGVVFLPWRAEQIDYGAAVACFRVSHIDSGHDRHQYNVLFAGVNTMQNPFYSISGSASFLESTETISSDAGYSGTGYTFLNAPNRDFTDWILVGVDLVSPNANEPIGFMVQISAGPNSTPGASINSAIVDFGFVGLMRRWETPPFFSAQGMQLTFDDLSTSQISDGRQKYSTKGQKRRRLQFNIGPTKEEGGVIGTDEAVGGLRTIADNVGTTEPLVVVPSDTRPLAPSLSMLGTLQSPISLDLVDGPYWRAPIVLEELM